MSNGSNSKEAHDYPSGSGSGSGSGFGSREDESEGEEDEGARNKGVSIAMGAMLTMPEGFGCLSDSTTTEETIKRLRCDYGIPIDVILSLPIKGYDAYTPGKGQFPIHIFLQLWPPTPSPTYYAACSSCLPTCPNATNFWSPSYLHPIGFFYLCCSNKMGPAVPNTKGKDGDWKSEWMVVERE
ncbi:hypothetical protein QYF36_020937 [Acer negundo]|nr:hypothetical protein QYF36_020937 [Acer negundo]